MNAGRACAIAVLFATTLAPAGVMAAGGERWMLNRLDRVGGQRPTIEGAPWIEETPGGRAVRFDGVDDLLLVDRHPLAGAETFTIEAMIRPDGGAFEQRLLHLASDGGEGTPAAGTRILFEIRVVGGEWYLDAYARGAGYALALVDPAKRHPVGRWYRIAQSFDGTTYRSYVDGVLQAQAPLAFRPQGPGRTAIGARMNRVTYFNGAIRDLRFEPGPPRKSK